MNTFTQHPHPHPTLVRAPGKKNLSKGGKPRFGMILCMVLLAMLGIFGKAHAGSNPVITLVGDSGLSDTIKLEQGYTYTDPGYSASSTTYGNLTNLVVVTCRQVGSPSKITFNNLVPATYIFSYDVTDPSSNMAPTQYRVIRVTADKTPPDLIVATPITYDFEVTKTLISPFPIPAVVSAKDLVDGDLSGSVTNDASKITSNILGTYTITYTVTDLSGNTATVYRYVNIIDTIAPVIKLKGSNPLYV